MSEPESKPPKQLLAKDSKLFEGINVVANSQAIEAVDQLALSDEEDLARDYPEALSSVQRAREDAEIEQLSEGGRQRRRVNVARLIVLGSLFFLIVLWIVSVILLTVACGLHWRGFTLSDKVIMTYITTTTASVFGLFYVAANWLFSKET
jgi:uncharacterized membrane protein